VSEAADGPSAAGLRNAVQQMLATLVGIGQSRLELISVELEEERLRLARQWIAVTATLFLSFVALVLLAGWIVLVCDPANRLAALGALIALRCGRGHGRVAVAPAHHPQIPLSARHACRVAQRPGRAAGTRAAMTLSRADTLAAAASPAALIRSGWRQLGARPPLAVASLGLLLIIIRLVLARRVWMRLLRV
jgi:hypothetical protein